MEVGKILTNTPVGLAETVSNVDLSVLESSFKRLSSADEPDSDGSIQVEGRVFIDTEESTVIVNLKMHHETKSVSGVLMTAMRYEWAESPAPSRTGMLNFAEQYGVANALPSTAALFNEEFRRFGVRISFPPPDMTAKIAKILVDDARGCE